MKYAVSVDNYYDYCPQVIVVDSDSPVKAMGMAINIAFGGGDNSFRGDDFLSWIRDELSGLTTVDSVQQAFFNGDIGVSLPVEI